MEEIRKTHFTDIGEQARQQYINAISVFTALEDAMREAKEVRGGMYWRESDGREYLIRTSPSNAQKSLGPKSPETEEIFRKFVERKASLGSRVTSLKSQMEINQRLNRAVLVGRTPKIVIDILNELAKLGLDEHFTVVGTHAIYAYEAAAGVRVSSADALATNDVDLLWDTRRRVKFVSQMALLGSSMIGILKGVDKSFKIRQNQKYTAVNDKGFEVDIIRREAVEGDPHPLRITDDEDDFWVTQARRSDVLLSSPKFSAVVASTSGHMARMNTISPKVFIDFKTWMAQVPDRDPIKRERDAAQADIVQAMVEEYLPHV